MTPLEWTVTGSVALLAYVHGGYGLVLRALAVVIRRPVRMADVTPPVALVVVALDEADVIAEKLRNTWALDYPRHLLEVVIVCDGSTDDTARIAAEIAGDRARVLHAPERRGKGMALNRGVAATTAPLIVCSDANAMYRTDALRQLARRFADPRVGLVSGRKEIRGGPHAVGDGARVYWDRETHLKILESRTGSTVGVVGEMLAIRRECYAPLPPDVILDDAYLAMATARSGLRVIFAPEAVSEEPPPATREDERRRRRSIAAGRYQLLARPRLWPWRAPLTLWKLVSHKFLRLLAPWLLIVALAGTMAIVARHGWRSPWGALLGAQAGAYALAIAGTWEKAGRAGRVAAYVLHGHLALLAAAYAAWSGRETVLWTRVRRGEPRGGTTP